MRVIADHARATAFSIADGILPANEGRNYVLRKIMRRAIYQGRHTLGFDGLFFHKVTNFVVDQMGEAYPELESHRDFIDLKQSFISPRRRHHVPCATGRQRREPCRAMPARLPPPIIR